MNQIEKIERIAQLEKLIGNPMRLTRDQYLDLLHEVRKNHLIRLAIASLQKTQKGTLSSLTIIEKVHWLIDSVEGSSGTDNTINVRFLTSKEVSDDKKEPKLVSSNCNSICV